ncbi:hypothetical protein Tsubulata_026099 [Turnera subulata]|uniref:AIR9-like A9 domain-containing protein n=1 Tax=Turnera subulata TaxID=218843 RepID=A0A9Q0JHM5_9ROSI|nr:hypothetical protein Tsubulata_026099 [Turnera subulata]
MCHAKSVVEDDPLPAIVGLQIIGTAKPGKEVCATGYCTNGTTSCKFAWLRGSDVSSMDYVEGADKASYEITEDDINMYLAVEVKPIDSRARQGQAERIFANDRRKINHQV